MLSGDRLQVILDLVERSLDDPAATGEDLAAQAYLSRFHFDRLVGAALGEPPGAFRRRLLLERAAHRLSRTDDAVIDVALDAGYAAPESFARAFTRAYGHPPSIWRHTPGRVPAISAPSGVHIHPPGGLALPATRRSTGMDVLTAMVDHHIWLVGEIADRTTGLPDATLDRPIELSVEGIDDRPTLRSLLDRLVGQLEMWVTALEGGTAMPPAGDTTAEGLHRRLDVAAEGFRRLVLDPVSAGQAGDTFVDAVCDPPETFTLGGVLAHVLTFAAVRRTLAVGALESAGITDLGAGDPMRFVGGSGADASTIRRRRGPG